MKRDWRNSEEWAQRIILVLAFWSDWFEESWEISRLDLNMAEYFEGGKNVFVWTFAVWDFGLKLTTEGQDRKPSVWPEQSAG